MVIKLNTPSPIRIVSVLTVLVGLLAVVNLILSHIVLTQHIESESMQYIFRLFLLDNEFNVPTWVSSIMISFAGFIFLLISYVLRQRQQKYSQYWMLLGIIFFALSAEEYMGLHEITTIPLRNLLNTGGLLYFAWVIPAIILVGLVALFYLRFFLQLPRKTRALFLLAAVMYIGGAIGMEAIGGFYFQNSGLNGMGSTISSQYDMVYLILATIEEVLEMLGMVTFIYLSLEYLQSLTTCTVLEIDTASEL